MDFYCLQVFLISVYYCISFNVNVLTYVLKISKLKHDSNASLNYEKIKDIPTNFIINYILNVLDKNAFII